IPLNGSSQIAADVIKDFLGLTPGVGGIEHFPLAVLIKRVARGEVLVVMIPESSSVEVVRARLGDDVDRCGTRHPFLRIVAVGGDFHFLNTLDRRDIKGGASRLPKENALRAVDSGGIGSGTQTVHGNGYGPLRRVGKSAGGSEIISSPRNQQHQVLIVTIEPGWQVLHRDGT